MVGELIMLAVRVGVRATRLWFHEEPARPTRRPEPIPELRSLPGADTAAMAEPAHVSELAAVELYEVTNRGRRTVLNAVERELRRVSCMDSRRNER